jgi:superfamily II DNA/RNA helicase
MQIYQSDSARFWWSITKSTSRYFKNGVDILIATPGRLLDLHKQGFIDLDHLHALVLDEADQMLDMGFVNDVKKIVSLRQKTDRPYFSRLQCQLPSEN